MDNLTQDIQEAIKNNLNALQADTLMTILKNAKHDKRDLEDARKRIKTLAESNAQFVENETDVSVRTKQKGGCSYSGGDFGTEIVVDLCPECFKNKLVLWLISQGTDIKEQDWGW